ncbi:MAG: ABC transporter ATP-binding protein [Planctomycetota bacterium]
MTSAVLALDGLTVRYGSFTALRGVDATFLGGSLGLLGPNGAGKSTMLRSILGLVRPAAGSARVLGVDARRKGTELRRRIGYMPERDAFIGGFSAVRGLAHLAEICGFPGDDAMLRAHDVLHFVGLGEERYREVHTFSTGMRQRYKLAAALVHDPEVLFLDEPTNGLDPQSRARMLGLIERITQTHGLHLILASHLLPDVERLCSEVWVMNKGEMRMSGSISELTAAARGARRVKVAPDRGPAFAAAAAGAGLSCEVGKTAGEYVVHHPERQLEPGEVFRLAQAHDVVVHGIHPAARSLEDAFLEALETA